MFGISNSKRLSTSFPLISNIRYMMSVCVYIRFGIRVSVTSPPDKCARTKWMIILHGVSKKCQPFVFRYNSVKNRPIYIVRMWYTAAIVSLISVGLHSIAAILWKVRKSPRFTLLNRYFDQPGRFVIVLVTSFWIFKKISLQTITVSESKFGHMGA